LAVLVASVAGVVLFTSLEGRWQVPGLALGHSIGFTVGAIVLGRGLITRIGPIGSTKLMATVLRSTSMAVVSGGVMAVVYNSFFVNSSLEGPGVLVAGTIGACVYLGAMTLMKTPEIGRLRALARGAR
jgi:peptidoglycan biosynthesis protein MviN/MurJ (putative lipid II flippase)